MVRFFLLAFPNANIIHIKRDRIDTCWSIFKHYFVSHGNSFSYDLLDLKNYYSLYEELMNFWICHFPNRILTIKYENLVLNQKKVTEQLLNFNNLQWEDKCLEFYNNQRTIKTASSLQVRNKIIKNTSRAWKL